MTRVGWFVALLALAGCKKVDEKIEDIVEDAGISTKPPTMPPVTPPELPSFSLPKSASGAYQLIQVAGSKLEIDPTLRDPLTAVGRCADLVTTCYQGGTALDGCVEQVRRCATSEPWKEDDDCCPADCAAAYADARGQGTAPIEAFESVYFLQADCFPGVKQAIGGAP